MYLFLIRHGSVDWNAEGRCIGRSDVPLNSQGIDQAARLAVSLAKSKMDLILTSPLERARRTAGALAEASSAELSPCPSLIEMGYGVWEGRLYADIRREWPREWGAWRRDPVKSPPPGGEDARSVLLRMRKILDETRKRRTLRRIALVGHQTALKLLILDLLGSTDGGRISRMHLSNCSVSTLWCTRTVCSVVSVNAPSIVTTAAVHGVH